MDRKAALEKRIAALEVREAELVRTAATQTINPTMSLSTILTEGYMAVLRDLLLARFNRRGLKPTATLDPSLLYVQVIFTLAAPDDMQGGDSIFVMLNLGQKVLEVTGQYESQGGADQNLLRVPLHVVMAQPVAKIAALIDSKVGR